MCNSQLSKIIGDSGSDLCLRPLNVGASSSNSSTIYVPVLVMKTGSTATITILYDNVLEGTQQYARGTSQPELPPLNANDTPYALSLSTGRVNTTTLGFSQGSLIFSNKSWSMYNYTLTASNSSAGYYAILPPFYFGFYPALYVEGGNPSINYSEFSMWGYQGMLLTQEYVLPSMIVGVRNMEVLNVTVYGTYSCPNAACSVITHSGY